MKHGEIRYNKNTDRWVFENQSDGFHCGEALEFKIGNRYVHGRLEYGTEWVVIFPDARFRLMNEWVYPVRVP
ncbi:hypothetical protein D2Q93_14810 [Alicyclobacillaceae bacterium I2511]|nr:hypothetical protein D2Q93_14810 [Alicyclobacillaceae bacterium I2511]